MDPTITDDGKATITHVARRDLPWRKAALTECGLDLEKHVAISPGDLAERVKKLGHQRTAMLTCMTCWNTSDRYGSTYGWRGPHHIVLSAIEREVQWARHHPGTAPFMADVKAIEVLVQRHRAEFDELLEDQRETVSLAEERKARRAPRGKQRW